MPFVSVFVQWTPTARCCSRCRSRTASWPPPPACRTWPRWVLHPSALLVAAPWLSQSVPVHLDAHAVHTGLGYKPSVHIFTSLATQAAPRPCHVKVVLTGEPALVSAACTLLLTVLFHNAGKAPAGTEACWLRQAGNLLI